MPEAKTDASTPRAVLTSAPIGRTLIRLTGPMMLGGFAIIGFNLADTYFVARLGTAALAAMGFTFPVVMMIGGLALGLGMGAASVVSHAIGEGNHHKVRRLATDSLFLAMVIVAAFSTVGIFTIDPLFRLMGARGEVLSLIRTYMTTWYWGTVFVVVPMVGNNIIRAGGDTKTPSLVMVLAAVVNVVLDPLLIFGLAGLPRLGLFGAALATVIARATTFTAALCILHFRDRILDLSVPRLRALWNSWRQVLSIGIPAAATNILMPLSIGVLTRIAAAFGREAVAAFGAGMKIEAFAMLPTMALGAVMVPFVGQNRGAGRPERVRKAIKDSFAFSLLWGLVALAVLAVLARTLGGLFSEDAQVVSAIAMYLWIVPIGYGCYAVFRIAGVSLNALGRPMRSLVLNVIRMLVLLVPLAWVGSRLLRYPGLLASVPVANACAAVVAVAFLRGALRPPEDAHSSASLP